MRSRVFLSEATGSATVLFALCITVLGLSAGIAVDYSRALNIQSELQSAADAAALAGASLPAATEEERIAAATIVFNENAKADLTSQPEITSIGGVVGVTLSTTIPTTLMQIVGRAEMDVAIAAEAANSVPQLACVITLEEAQFGLQANSASTLDAACGVQVNSEHNEATYVNSNSHVVATSVCVHGSAVTNSASTISPTAIEGCPQVSDPLAALPEPPEAAGACDYTDFTVNSMATATMMPGVYCGNTVINSASVATMEPGVYVFRGGEFVINSLSAVNGSQVLLYFSDKDARLNVNSGSSLQITAPAAGTYAGILMFQSRHASTKTAPPTPTASRSSKAWSICRTASSCSTASARRTAARPTRRSSSIRWCSIRSAPSR